MRRHIAACVLLLYACATAPSAPDVQYTWPAGAVRLELERVIGEQTSSSLGRWLGTGNRELPQFLRPYGVTWDGEDLVIADPDANRVFRAARRGSLRMSAPLEGPTGVATCGGEIVITESRTGRVVALGRDLRLTRVLARDLVRPTGVACHDDAVYVVETGRHRLVAISLSGAQRAIGTRGGAAGEFNYPAALAIAGDAAFVGDTLNFRVQRVPLGAGETSIFGALGDTAGDTPRIKGIAIDRNGVWVSDAHLDHIALFDAEGRLLGAVGRRGEKPGEFSFPAGLAVSNDGRLAVADSLNRRVQIFRIVPEAVP